MEWFSQIKCVQMKHNKMQTLSDPWGLVNHQQYFCTFASIFVFCNVIKTLFCDEIDCGDVYKTIRKPCDALLK